MLRLNKKNGIFFNGGECPFNDNGWQSWGPGRKTLFTPWGSVDVHYPPVLDRPITSFRTGNYAAGMLLAWRNLPDEVSTVAGQLWRFICAIGGLLLCLVMPLLFWVAPLLAWVEAREARKAAARRAARRGRGSDMWDDES